MSDYQPNIVTPSPPEPVNETPSNYESDKGDPNEYHGEQDPDLTPLVLTNTPTIVDILGISDFYDDDIDNLQKKAEYIDTQIKKEIVRREWMPIVKSYKDVLDKVCNKVGIKNESGMGTLNKLYIYFYINLPTI